MTAGGTLILGSQWKHSWAIESAYGTDPGTSAYTKVLGVVQTATLPDPNVNYQPVWTQGTASTRNWSVAYKNQISLGGSIPDIWLLDGRPLALLGSTITTGGPAPYTHTISESNIMPSFAMHVTYNNTSVATALMRRYTGGKINRATISGSEGDFLKLALDEVLFVNYLHDQNTTDTASHYSAGVADVTIAYPATQPYLFSYGALSLAGTVFARIRSFSLSISQNLDAKYYITTGAPGGNNLPYEYREGQRQYQLNVTVDIEDAALYRELVRMGTYTSSFTGFQVIISFTRGANDSIVLTMPTTTPATGLDAMGCLIQSAPHNIVTDPVVSVPLTIIGRNLGIVVTDAIASYA